MLVEQRAGVTTCKVNTVKPGRARQRNQLYRTQRVPDLPAAPPAGRFVLFPGFSWTGLPAGGRAWPGE